MGLLTGALLAGGPFLAAEAAPLKDGNPQQAHSTETQALKETLELTQRSNRGRVGAPALPATAVRLADNRRPKSKAGKDNQSPHAASPRAWAGDTAGRSPSSTGDAPVAADPAAVREALARRRAWNRPRLEALQPAKVQDPPAVRALPSAAGPLPIPAEEAPRVVMARPTEPPLDPSGPQADLIREALRRRGTPYVWGGASRGGFDCSGFICYIYRKQRGIILPHSASAQARLGAPVPRVDLVPGDLVFFSTYRRGISHVGIYLGENRFIHAANQRKDTRIDTLTGYYDRRYRGARRLLATPLEFNREELDELTRNRSELPGGD